MINDQTLAKNFKALAHPRRAMLFRLLALRPELGASQKTLLAAARLPYASFAHHMKQLESARLVRRREQRGSVSYATMPDDLSAALVSMLRLAEQSRPRTAKAA